MNDHAVVALDECDPESVGGRFGHSRGASGHVVLVGVGLGGPLRLTLEALKAISEADVIILSQSVEADLLEEPEIEWRPDAPVLTAGDEPDLDKVVQLAKRGLVIAWLLSGDPVIDGEGAPLAVSLAALGCRTDMVPGLARAALALTTSGVHPGAGGLRLTSGLGLADAPESLVALLDADQVPELARQVQNSGVASDEPALVTYDYARTTQESVSTTLAGLTKIAVQAEGVRVSVVIGAAAQRDPSLNWYESKPLFGWRVLVPRTKGLSGITERRLEHHGAIPVQVPTISVEPPRNPQPMERAIQGLVDGRYQWIIFNSPNAVRAVTERLSALGLDSRAFSGLRIAAVGADTVDALRNWGITADLVPEGEQRGEALAAEFPVFDDVLDPINRIFIPRADVAVDSLVTSMNELGWEVEDVIAYRTVRAAPPPAEIREWIKAGLFDAVLFSSASTVRNMVGIAGKPHPDTIVAAIGPATVASCQEHGLRVDVVPDRPGQIELVDALAEYATARRDEQIARGEPVRRPSQRRTRRRK